MNKKILLFLIIGILIFFPRLLEAREPERGKYVPADLETRTHPFVEQLVHGDKYLSGRLVEEYEKGWRTRIYFPEESKLIEIPETRINLADQLRSPGTSVVIQQTEADRLLITGLNRTSRYLLMIALSFIICLVIGGKITGRGLLSVLLGTLFFIFWTVPRVQAGSWILFEISLFYLLVSLMVLPSSLGINRRALAAILTSLSTGIISLLFLTGISYWFRITGLFSEAFQALDYAIRYFPGEIALLDLHRLIIGATLIGALGVILDVSIDVTASAAEITSARPDLDFTELLKRTLTVSRRLVGTMTNTLLLAYVGSNLFLLLNIYLLPAPTRIVLNRDLVAVEVTRALGGALGFLAAMPIAVGFYALVCRKKEEKPPPPNPLNT